jgi:gluconate 2-dehydrogenase gamma chain
MQCEGRNCLTNAVAIHTVTITSDMDSSCKPRREFLLQLAGTAGAALISAQWPAVAAAAQHAHEAKNSAKPYKFEVLTPEQAKEVAAIAARIIPTDELPGATEAGVVYFVDYALKTFAADARPMYETGLLHINEVTSTTFPGVARFSAASTEQQDKIMETLFRVDASEKSPGRHRRDAVSNDFMQTIRLHTVAGVLITPEGGGNRDYAGWKVIGRDPEHTFSSPFGFYDKDYPGWQPATGGADKK